MADGDFTLGKLYAPWGEGGGPTFPLASGLSAFLSHLSKLVGFTGCLLFTIFSSFFEVLD